MLLILTGAFYRNNLEVVVIGPSWHPTGPLGVLHPGDLPGTSSKILIEYLFVYLFSCQQYEWNWIRYIIFWSSHSKGLTSHRRCCHLSHCHCPLRLPVKVPPFLPVAEQPSPPLPPPPLPAQLSSFCLFLLRSKVVIISSVPDLLLLSF